MKPADAVSKFRDYMRLKHMALSTEQSYCAWLTRFMRFLAAHPLAGAASEAKVAVAECGRPVAAAFPAGSGTGVPTRKKAGRRVGPAVDGTGNDEGGVA